MAKKPVFEVDIQTMVYGGDGMGRLPDGRAVFVPGVLPGERVRVRLVEEKKRMPGLNCSMFSRPPPTGSSPEAGRRAPVRAVTTCT